jgi:plastocyanin
MAGMDVGRARWSRRRLVPAVALAVVSAATVAGCGGSNDSGGDVTNEGVSTVPGARVVWVEATDFAFAPSEITATPGEQLTVEMTSVRGRHDLVLIGAESVRVAWASEGQTAIGGMTAPSEPGVYRFICSEIGHLTEGMEGQLVVG